MSGSTSVLEEAVTLALKLSPIDKVRLVERIVATLEHDLAAPAPMPRQSFLGLCADLGPAPSAEEIDEARREAWATFPREDAY